MPSSQKHMFPTYDKHFGGSFNDYQKKQYLEALLLVQNMDLAIDVGAHVGIFSSRMAKSFRRVHSFEPDPLNFKCLKLNMAKFPNATLHNLALSDENGTCSVVRNNPTNSGDISIDPTAGEIPRLKLDSFNFDNVGFIKIDTQGHELPIVKGAEETIRRCRPVMLIELPSKELVKLLFDWNYDISFKHGKDVGFQPKEQK